MEGKRETKWRTSAQISSLPRSLLFYCFFLHIYIVRCRREHITQLKLWWTDQDSRFQLIDDVLIVSMQHDWSTLENKNKKTQVSKDTSQEKRCRAKEPAVQALEPWSYGFFFVEGGRIFSDYRFSCVSLCIGTLLGGGQRRKQQKTGLTRAYILDKINIIDNNICFLSSRVFPLLVGL